MDTNPAASVGQRIGGRIEKARRARHWEQATLARKAGVSASYLGRLERGEYPAPSITKVVAIADALGFRVSDLIDQPGAAPGDMVDQIRDIVGTDEGMLAEVLEIIRREPPESRPGALRLALQALRLAYSVTPTRN